MIDFVNIAQAASEAAAVEAKAGVLETLGINWKLFLAQLLNFGIILALLWKYALGPVSKKLHERSEKIDKALKDAEDIEREKTDFSKWKDEEISKTRTEAAAIIAQSQKEAEAVKKDILEKTRAEQSKLVENAKKQVISDQEKAVAEIKSEVADLVTMATEKILKEKLTGKHDEELIKKTVAELAAKKK